MGLGLGREKPKGHFVFAPFPNLSRQSCFRKRKGRGNNTAQFSYFFNFLYISHITLTYNQDLINLIKTQHPYTWHDPSFQIPKVNDMDWFKNQNDHTTLVVLVPPLIQRKYLDRRNDVLSQQSFPSLLKYLRTYEYFKILK